MLDINEKEYELLRHEMMEMKGCTTTYLNFSFALVGVVLSGSVLMSQVSPSDLKTAYLLIAGLTGLSAMGLVIVYKARSHNRYAGYLAALSSETLVAGGPQCQNQQFLWEWALYRWRHRTRDELTHGQRTRAFLRPIWLGIRSLVGASEGRNPEPSWAFPPVLVRVLIALSMVLLSGLCLVVREGDSIQWPGWILLVICLLFWLFVVRGLGVCMDDQTGTIGYWTGVWQRLHGQLLLEQGVQVALSYETRASPFSIEDRVD